MAPTIFYSLLSRSLSAREPEDVVSSGPLAVRSALESRDNAPTVDPHAGSIAGSDINNNALFAIFGIIGAAIVVTGIWFFFWAKNGGFHFKKDDWSEYKSTVLRRRGPNGTILSNATPSTNLGGGSIYKDVVDDNSTEDTRTVLSGSTAMTGITAGVSDIGAREKRRKKKEQRERERERRREEKDREKAERKSKNSSSRKVNAEGVLIDEEAEAEAKAHLRKYRHEKPARVGGLNKEGDGSTWDGSTNPTNSTMSGSGMSGGGSNVDSGSTVTSELISHRERTPNHTPTRQRVYAEPSANPNRSGTNAQKSGGSGGIRKVYSTADKNADREGERIRAEARRLQERGRQAVAAQAASSAASGSGRRDFSWAHADETSHLRGGGEDDSGDIGTQVPGSWAESDVGTSSDVGTKVYKHSVHIPGTSTSDFAYQEEKRKRRGGAGYRRGQE